MRTCEGTATAACAAPEGLVARQMNTCPGSGQQHRHVNSNATAAAHVHWFARTEGLYRMSCSHCLSSAIVLAKRCKAPARLNANFPASQTL